MRVVQNEEKYCNRLGICRMSELCCAMCVAVSNSSQLTFGPPRQRRPVEGDQLALYKRITRSYSFISVLHSLASVMPYYIYISISIYVVYIYIACYINGCNKARNGEKLGKIINKCNCHVHVLCWCLLLAAMSGSFRYLRFRF